MNSFTILGPDSQRFLSKNSYLSATFVVIFRQECLSTIQLEFTKILCKNSYLRIA